MSGLGLHVARGLVFRLPGRLDANNAPEVDEQLDEEIASGQEGTVVLDAADTRYVSSAGLRVILRLVKRRAVRIENVSPEVYGILEMTGFTEMIDVHKALREVSVEGCEVIGTGANGTVYRIDPETIVKVYSNPDSLPDIERERALARRAFVMGVPTAISYDVVRVGDLYGSVFELLNAKSYCQLLVSGDMSVDEAAQGSAQILKQMHANEVDGDLLPDHRDISLQKVARLEHVWPTSVTEGLRALIEAMPSCRRMLHGDFHVKNIMVQKGEALLIDMDTLCVGDPVFEFAGMYKPYISYPEIDPGNLERFFGISDEVGRELWEGTARHYFGELSAERWAQLVDRSRPLASLSTGASFAKKDLGKPRNREALDHFQAVVEELLPRVDHLALLD
jgi:uncharacterized protein (TIGR02172 family)